jgi:hypothetical protein
MPKLLGDSSEMLHQPGFAGPRHKARNTQANRTKPEIMPRG